MAVALRRSRLLKAISGVLVAGAAVTSAQLLFNHGELLSSATEPCTPTHLGDLARWWEKPMSGGKALNPGAKIHTGAYGNGQGKLWLLVDDMSGASLLDKEGKVVSSAFNEEYPAAKGSGQRATKALRLQGASSVASAASHMPVPTLSTMLAAVLHNSSEWRREQRNPRSRGDPSEAVARLAASRCSRHVFFVHSGGSAEVETFSNTCYDLFLGFLDPRSVGRLAVVSTSLRVGRVLADTCAARFFKTGASPEYAGVLTLALPRARQARNLLAGVATQCPGLEPVVSELSAFLLSHEACACRACGTVFRGGQIRNACRCSMRSSWGCGTGRAAGAGSVAAASASLLSLSSPLPPLRSTDRTNAARPWYDARCKQVRPTLFVHVTSIPYPSISCASSVYPFSAHT